MYTFEKFRFNQSNKSRTCQPFITAANQCIWQSSKKKISFFKKNKTLSLSMLSSMAKSVFTNGPTKSTSHKRLFSLMKEAVLENFLIGGLSFFLWLWKKHSLPSYLKGNSAK
jgi:hypothetical protein